MTCPQCLNFSVYRKGGTWGDDEVYKIADALKAGVTRCPGLEEYAIITACATKEDVKNLVLDTDEVSVLHRKEDWPFRL